MEVQTKRIHLVLTPDCFWLLHPNLHAPLIYMYISKHQRNLENVHVRFNFDFDLTKALLEINLVHNCWEIPGQLVKPPTHIIL